VRAQCRIEEIKSREVLTKSAKRTLGRLKKKLMIEESKNNSEKLDTTEKKSNKQDKHQDTGVSVKNKEKINKDKTIHGESHANSFISNIFHKISTFQHYIYARCAQKNACTCFICLFY
jgi:hypothetical protein